MLRLRPQIHQRLSQLAGAKGVSLNQICTQLLEKSLFPKREKPDQDWSELISLLSQPLKKKFGSHLLGIILFGSRISGASTASSDLDVLIVLDPSKETCRSFYQWWDGQFSQTGFKFELSPHFVNLPDSPSNAGSLWFEVALSSHLLYQREKIVAKWLQEVREFISEGNVRREWVHGHPYWARRTV